MSLMSLFSFLMPSSTKTPYNACTVLPKWVLPPKENTEEKDQEDEFCPSY